MQEDLLLTFGKTIRKIRLSKNISQEKFADLCNLHRTYISDIELGKRNVSLENIGKMASALDMNISELFQEVESDAMIIADTVKHFPLSKFFTCCFCVHQHTLSKSVQ